LRIVNENIFETFQTCTEFGRITHFDIILISILTIFGSNGTIDTITQIITCSSQVQSVHRQFLAVEINLIFRLVIATADVNLSYTFHVQQFTFQTGGHAIGRRHIISVYLKIGTCLSRHTGIATSQNNLCFTELRISFQVLTHLIADCFQRNITVARVHQTDVEGNDMRTVVLHRSPSIIGICLTYSIVTYLHDVLIFSQPLISQFL